MLRRSTILDEWARVRGFPAGFALPANRGLTTDEIERFARAIEERTLRRLLRRKGVAVFKLELEEMADRLKAERKRLETE